MSESETPSAETASNLSMSSMNEMERRLTTLIWAMIASTSPPPDPQVVVAVLSQVIGEVLGTVSVPMDRAMRVVQANIEYARERTEAEYAAEHVAQYAEPTQVN